MLWFYDAILEARSGTFWKDLVSLQEIVEAREAFGTERAFGAIFFYTGGFNSMDEYLKFVQAQVKLPIREHSKLQKSTFLPEVTCYAFRIHTQTNLGSSTWHVMIVPC